jgi:threonylcarbamoyladenosine tRNA methylthiotransferase MtaB
MRASVGRAGPLPSPGVTGFAVKFLGCKVSQADAMLARGALLAAGHSEVAEEEAELHVINTCCITAEAESKSRQAVRRSLGQAGRVHVAGCAVNLAPARFAEIDPRVRTFVGMADDVAEAMGEAEGGFATGGRGPDLACADTEHDVLARERLGIAGLARTDRSRATARTRGFVKVQDGCDCHCAYCIIPTVRGPARSRPASAILREVERRVAEGQPEMVMTGISVGDYRDPERGLELGELMMEVARVPGVKRVRLSSVEVIHVKDSLLRALCEEPKVCPHLHVPLQSGDDGVLAAMGRHYTAGEYLAHIGRVREATGGRRKVQITADVIVGFPTEDEAAFARTLDVVEQAELGRMHVFPYSPRPGTVAAELGDRVPAEVKKERGRRLRALSEVRSRLHRAPLLGSELEVLIDKVAADRCSGYTPDYTRCYLDGAVACPGELLTARARELHADGIRCELA